MLPAARSARIYGEWSVVGPGRSQPSDRARNPPGPARTPLSESGEDQERSMKVQDWPIPDEQLARLFTPHLVLPEQFFDGTGRHSAMDGERRLLLAILEDAVQ